MAHGSGSRAAGRWRNVTELCRLSHKLLLIPEKKHQLVPNFSGRPALSGTLPVMATMQVDLDLIFPMRDAPSAELMAVKAACLCNAGVIDARQKNIVEQRAREFLRGNIWPTSTAACTPSDASSILRKRSGRRALRRAA